MSAPQAGATRQILRPTVRNRLRRPFPHASGDPLHYWFHDRMVYGRPLGLQRGAATIPVADPFGSARPKGPIGAARMALAGRAATGGDWLRGDAPVRRQAPPAGRRP